MGEFASGGMQDDLAFLVAVGERLASSLDYRVTLQTVSELLLPRIADYCIIYAATDYGSFDRVSCCHVNPEMQPTLDRFCESPLDRSSQGPVAMVFREGKSVVVPEIRLEKYEEITSDHSIIDPLRALNPTSCIIAPLIAAGKSVGALTLCRSESGLHYSEDDLLLVEEVARRVAYAMEHARFFEDSRRAQQTQQLLTLASLELAKSLDYSTTLKNIAHQVVPDLAEWCGIDVLHDGGSLERVAVAHVDPEKVKFARELQEKYPVDMDDPAGVPNVLRTGKPELYSSIPQEMLKAAAKDEEHWKIIQSVQIGSAMIVPLLRQDKAIGVISFVAAEQGRYTEYDLRLAEELAIRASLALTNSQLYTAAQKEIAERESAEAKLRALAGELEAKVQERTRELLQINEQLQGFTYTVAHDLRQQIRGINVNASIVLQDAHDKLDAATQNNLTRIAASAKQLALLVDDLLKYAKLGRQEPAREQVDISAIAEDIVSEVRPKYTKTVEVEIQPGLTAVADPTMTRIVLENLIDNAFKYSGAADQAKITIGQDERGFYVEDTGIGFDMAFADRLFEPFERLHSATDFSGTGIGLANVKRIVQKHGGTIEAKSEPGRGSTFVFSL